MRSKNTKDFGNYDVIMRDDAIGQNKNAPVDYYMLALSWSPAFCENNVHNMAIIYLIQRNINVVQKSIWLGSAWFMAAKCECALCYRSPSFL